METFKFKKAEFVLDKNVVEEFNRLFSKIRTDAFLTNTHYGVKVKPITLTGYDRYLKEDLGWTRRDAYEPSMDKFMGEEYDAKQELYHNFLKWLTFHNKNNTILGRVHCPYTNEVIREENFPTVYSLEKSSYHLGGFEECGTAYKIKVKDVFKINLKNDPQNHMSKKALDLFFDYWSYDVLYKVTLKGAKDKNLLAVTSRMGKIYYGDGDETWANQMYYSPKGFFVKMKKERIYVPCPSYKGLTDDLEVLSRGGVPILDKDKLPTLDDRVRNAIEFGVLDESLMPKEEHLKVEAVKRIKQIIDNLDSEESRVNAYDLIKVIMKDTN